MATGELVHRASTALECGQPLTIFGVLKRPNLARVYKQRPNSVIELPEGIIWLGDKSTFSNQLFMRPCYSGLLEAKRRVLQVEEQTQRSCVHRDWKIAFLCAFISSKTDSGYSCLSSLLTSDGNVEKMFYRLDLASGVHGFPSQVLDSVSCNEDAMYIVDGLFPSFPSAQVEIQVFASPSKLLFKIVSARTFV